MTESLRCRSVASRKHNSARVVVALILLPSVAWGQSVVIEPTLSVTGTVTDRRSSVAGSDDKPEFVTQISPGVLISSRSGALQGSLNYAANGVLHVGDSSKNRVTHSLSSAAGYSLFEGRLGINASASAYQQVVSAFGTQNADSSIGTDNQAQAFSYSISPYLTGRLLGDTTYQARVNYSESRTESGFAGNTSSLVGSVGLAGRLGLLGWGLSANRQITESGDEPRAHNGGLVGSLNYQPDIEWQLALRFGREVDDVRTGQSQATTTWGAGVAWQPGPRTSVSLDYDQRYFGKSHAFAFSHRMARTIWTLSDTRSVQLGGARGRVQITTYDLFFAQFASVEPDPVKRDALVRSFLGANGLDAASPVIVGGFLTSAPSIQRTQQIGVGYQGLRSTLTVKATRSTSSRLSETQGVGDDFGSTDQIRQTGLSVTISHRLTPVASVAVTASGQRTSGNGLQAANTLRSLIASWSTELGAYTSVSLGARYSSFDSSTSPYTESVVFGSIRMRF